MPVDISQLIEGWLELESDPGLFTLLLEDFGVKGVQVDEIYDLQKPIESPVYGFIFLFRWTEERRSRRKVIDKGNLFVKDEELVNNLFFAQQMVPNSCATHALLSVLLNCPKINLGETLTRLKTHTYGMNPENKGWAIGNTPELAKAHNSHAMPQARRRLDKTSGVSTGRCVADAYHFVSYVPINGLLFELDGLKPYPIDHGPWGENEDWTEKFSKVIKDRLGGATNEANSDICYNLMAVVPDKRLSLTHKISMLRTNRQIVLDALQQLVQLNNTSHGSNLEIASEQQKSPSGKRYLSSPLQCREKNSCSGDSAFITPTKVMKILNCGMKTPVKNESTDAECNLKTNIKMESPTNSKVMVVLTPTETHNKTTDYSTPLSIQTSPAPSSSSTDTSSEVGSAFNSPGRNSPICPKDFNKFVVIRVAMENTGEESKGVKDSSVRKVCLEAGALPIGWEKPSGLRMSNLRVSPLAIEKKSDDQSGKKMESSNHTFAPKDLLALVKNIEAEITVCEGLLRDENEKRKQYKIDYSRRTHNYDQFICTFLSMLAQQGKLADLVQQHLSVPKKPNNTIGIQPPIRTSINKSQSQLSASRRRRGRNKPHTRK